MKQVHDSEKGLQALQLVLV